MDVVGESGPAMPIGPRFGGSNAPSTLELERSDITRFGLSRYGAAMGVRLDPIDEFMHELGPEPNFNESMYFNCYDPAHGVGGWFRIGNRANEGYAEMTVCLYLPDGKVGFQFKRPQIDNNDAFDAGGLHIQVIQPFEEIKLSYSGKVCLLDQPLEMIEPKVAFTTNPHVPCTVDLTILGRSAMFGGEPDTPHEKPGEEFARGHYEQLLQAVGVIAVGDQRWEISGFGLRDHSWGPRYWQAIWYYRWLTANFGPDFGFMGSLVARKDGPPRLGGFVWEGGSIHLVDDVNIETDWVGDERYHQQLKLRLSSSKSAKTWEVAGTALSLIPLRNRRATPDGGELLTRISEAMTRWDTPDGKVGYGLSEYLDQIVDGIPVGSIG